MAPHNATNEYFMSKMGVRRRQIVIELKDQYSAVVQAGAMQWMAGKIQVTTGVKGVGDLLGKVVKGAVTKGSAIKPEYVGNGILVLEPTYKYLLLVDVIFCVKGKDMGHIIMESLLLLFHKDQKEP